jgi:hypothetical protein
MGEKLFSDFQNKDLRTKIKTFLSPKIRLFGDRSKKGPQFKLKETQKAQLDIIKPPLSLEKAK